MNFLEPGTACGAGTGDQEVVVVVVVVGIGDGRGVCRPPPRCQPYIGRLSAAHVRNIHVERASVSRTSRIVPLLFSNFSSFAGCLRLASVASMIVVVRSVDKVSLPYNAACKCELPFACLLAFSIIVLYSFKLGSS
jgi:hypothetical protein